MYLVELFLPKTSQDVDRRDLFEQLKLTLADKFGGVTSYLRQSADGLWKDDQGKIEHDHIGVIEVQVEELDVTWWTSLRKELESRLQQEQVLIRASKIDVI